MNFPLSLFDIAVAALVIFGIFRGRRRGMSEELLPVLQWLLIVYLASLLYEPVGRGLSQMTSIFSLLTCYITVYVVIAVLIKVIFTLIRRGVGDKLMGSDVFGKLEFYLGMLAGALRFLCMVIVFLALLHAKAYTVQEKAETARKQQENFGSISFPTPASIQDEVFERSFSGRMIAEHLSQLLIKATTSEGKTLATEGIGRKRESAVDEVIGGAPKK